MPSKLLKFLLAAALPMFATDDEASGGAAQAPGNDAGGASADEQSTGETSADAASGSSEGAESGETVAAAAAAAPSDTSVTTSAVDAASDATQDAGEQGNVATESQPASGLSDAAGSSTDAGDAQGDAGNARGAAADAVSATDGSTTAPNSDAVSSIPTTPESNLGSSTDAPAVADESGEGVASLAASESASDTSSSVLTASQDGDTEAAILTGSDTADALYPLDMSFSASDWAAAFQRIVVDRGVPVTEDLMTSWFAGALMRGFDEFGEDDLQPVHSIFGEIEAELSRPTGVLPAKIRAIIARGRALL